MKEEISETLKKFIQRLKWIALCKKCGMNPDTCEVNNDNK